MSEKKVSFGWAFKEYIWPRKKIVSIGLVLIIIKSLSGLAMPYVLKVLVDDVFTDGNLDYLYFLIYVLAGALLIQGLTSFALTRLLSVEAQHLISLLRAKVQKKLLKFIVIPKKTT